MCGLRRGGGQRDRGRQTERQREGERGGRETTAPVRCAPRTSSMTRDAQGAEGCHPGQGPGVKKTHQRKTPSQDLVPYDPTGKPAEVAGPGTGPLLWPILGARPGSVCGSWGLRLGAAELRGASVTSMRRFCGQRAGRGGGRGLGRCSGDAWSVFLKTAS